MAGPSNIEWTERTWNPIVGCGILSPGCTNCYAMAMASRIEAMNAALPAAQGAARHYDGTTRKVNGKAVWTGKLALAGDDILLAPLKRKTPTTYFVNSMGDLFHEDVPDEWIDRVSAVMALAPQHTFQVLTKRAARMQRYVLSCCAQLGRQSELRTLIDRFEQRPIENAEGRLRVSGTPQSGWQPLPNVWLGVSTERQKEADERIPLLLRTPAAVRFISAEPLLGPLDLRTLVVSPNERRDCLTGELRGVFDGHTAWRKISPPVLDWVIVGGESGAYARPAHPDWVRSLRDQCAAASTPFFFKQWGNWRPEIDRDKDDPDWRQPYADYREPHFQILNLAGGRGFHGARVHVMRRCSKASAGRLLDGVEHNGMPEARA